MDYRLNNEAIVGCVAAQVVRYGCQKLPSVVAVTNLLMHDTERKKVKSMPNSRDLTAIVNQIDGGLLTIIMNSLAILIQGGCLTFDVGVLTLTPTGLNLCEQMKDGRSEMLSGILRDLPAVMKKAEKMENGLLDQRYVIAL
jgi:hypothetical protein